VWIDGRKPASTLTVGAVSMELFRTQEDYDTFNLKMSNIFGIDCIPSKLTDKDNTFQPENIIEPWNKGLKGQQTPWNKGKNINSENMIRVKVTNGTKIFNSLKEAAEYEGVTSGAIIGRIKRSKKWSYVKTN